MVPETEETEAAEGQGSRFGFQPGEIPGAAVYTGEARDFDVGLRVFDWTADEIEETANATIDQAASVRGRATVSWVDVTGIHDVAAVRKVGMRFGMHPLSIEDVVNSRHRPKIENYPEYVYVVLKMAHLTEDGHGRLEQVSMVLGSDFVLTFQEEHGDVFAGVRTRLRSSTGRIRGRGHDYLAYALMDAVVDSYVEVIDSVGERVEAAETLLDAGNLAAIRDLPSELHDEKRELMALRKAVLPLRDAISVLSRNEDERIQPRNLPYFRDLHDHLVQVVDNIDIYRDMIANLLNLHLAVVGQKTNEEMRVLTVIATIFIPLTFIVGVYGMNFEDMPELQVGWAYPALWVVMLLIAAALLVFFRRRGWL